MDPMAEFAGMGKGAVVYLISNSRLSKNLL